MLRMLRINAMRAIYPELSRCVVVTNMGAAPAELFSLGHQPGFFYLWHSMGLASSVGLGIALSRPELQVVVIDGDGSLLMNLGSLTTLARYQPSNLIHVVFDNEVLLSVGRSFTTATATGTDLAAIATAAAAGLPTAPATGTDPAAMATAAGVPRTATCRTEDELRTAFVEALAARELSTLVAKVEPVGPPNYFIDLHYLESRFQFQRHL